MLENISELSNLHFDFEYKKRFIHAYLNENNYFTFNTPLLKVLKPIHVSYNKKKNISKNYIILEINENQNMHQELDDMAIIVNKIHEISQVNIQKNSIKWFNTEFDDIGLDMKVKRPIDNQKDKNFIKILINNDDELLKRVENLEKDCYISCNLGYKGLKVNSDHLMEEYILYKFIDEEELNEINNEINEENSQLNTIIDTELEKELENKELVNEEINNEELVNEEIENEEIINNEIEIINEEIKENLELEEPKLIQYNPNIELEVKSIEKNKEIKEENEKEYKNDTLKNAKKYKGNKKNKLFENKKNNLEKINLNKKLEKRKTLQFAKRQLKVLKFVD